MVTEKPPLRAVVMTGEVSGDILGAQLMKSLKQAYGAPVVFKGIGGIHMKEEGLDSIFPLSDLSIIGVAGILRNFLLLRRRLRQAVELVVQEKPDVLIMIDNPAFTHRVALKVRRLFPDMPIINYVPPTVWAWGRWRLKTMARCFDRVLSIFPFEPQFFKQHSNIDCVYVGHPQLHLLNKTDEALPAYIDQEKKLFLILPGSRRFEINALMPVFKEVFGLLKETLADYQLVLPTLPSLHPLVQAHLKDWALPVQLCTSEEEKYRLMQRAHLALAASGTVTLELGLCGVPMLVAYKKTAWEFFLLRRFIIRDKNFSFAMVNIILGRRAVPECIQETCTPLHIKQALLRLLTDKTYYQNMKEELAQLGKTMLNSVHEKSVGQLILETVEKKRQIL